MIKIEKTEVMGWESAIRGMRNPMNSWNRSDSGICGRGDMHIGCDNCANRIPCNHSFDGSWQLGQEDHCLMMKLAKAGSVHGKFRRMITVYVDITAPIYFWSEFDTYKVGTVANSTSTMHKIHAKEFTLDDFSCEHLKDFDGYQDPVTNSPAITWFKMLFNDTIEHLNMARKLYLQTGDKQYWWQMIQLLPNSYHYTRTVMLNYEVLSGIYKIGRAHV